MKADAPLIREALVLAGHLIETHLGAQLVGPELILAVVVDPVFIKGVASEGCHWGPLGIALFLPPGIRPLSWVSRTLGWLVSIPIRVVALPKVALSH